MPACAGFFDAAGADGICAAAQMCSAPLEGADAPRPPCSKPVLAAEPLKHEGFYGKLPNTAACAA